MMYLKTFLCYYLSITSNESGVIMFKTFEQVICFFSERKKFGIKPGLERIKSLLYLLNNPQDKVKAIHIAGTNGKGSTISFLKQALSHNGYKIGIFTSPSLEGLTGHILNDDEKITKIDFIKLLNKIYPAIVQLDDDGNHPTEFEIITALAFSYFVNSVDIALIETGMGGKDDTTNCFQPMLSIITSIDKDHTAFLGNSLTEIATHKAGIIKHKTPIIIGKMEEEARSVVIQTATLNDAPIYEIGKEFTYELVEQSLSHQVFKWNFGIDKPIRCAIKMLGEHQVQNCSLALMGLNLLYKSGYLIDKKNALDAIYKTIIPGRLEVINKDPTIILDGAHNPAGIKAFLKTVNKYFPHSEKHLLFAAFKDKDVKYMLKLLDGEFSNIIVTSFNHDRAWAASQLAKNISGSNIIIENNWRNFISQIDLKLKNEDVQYFITGSLHFIAEVRLYFENKIIL